jgi:hypothetical protein
MLEGVQLEISSNQYLEVVPYKLKHENIHRSYQSCPPDDGA